MSYKYRVDSSLRGTTVSPQSFCNTAWEINHAVLRHAQELPGCFSRITDLETGQTVRDWKWEYPETLELMVKQTHLGLQFKDHAGILVTCYQLLDADGRAIAVADFEDSKLTRFAFIRQIEDSAPAWKTYVQGLVNSQIKALRA